jgi:hypothetical protein
MMLSLIMDGVVALLLATTIYYCWRLNRFISIIREGKEELSLAVRDFNDAIVKAEASVEEFKQNSRQVIERLQVKIEKAEFMADDLAYLMEKANKSADRLQQSIHPASHAPAVNPAKTAPARTGERTMENPARATVATKPMANTKAAVGQKSGLESLARTETPPTHPLKKPSADASSSSTGKPKSKAELELMQALKSIR